MMTRSSLRRTGMLAAACLTAATVAACGGSSGTAAEDGELEKSTLKVGILPTPDYVAAQIAIDQGFFEEEGLEVTTELMSGGNSAPSIVGGSYDIGGMNWISFVVASSSDLPLSAVAEGSLGVPGYASFLVNADSPAQTLEDLDGGSVGVVASPGACDLLALEELDARGSDAALEFVSLAVPDMPANVQRGNVDAACVPEPLGSALIASGDFRSVHDLFDTEAGQEFPVSGFVASQSFAQENPESLAAFQRAIQRAVDLIHEDPAVLGPALLEYTTLTEDQIAQMTLPDYVTDVTDFDNLDRVGDLVEKLGLVDEATIPSGS